MSSLYSFSCERCSYYAEVSGGGDAGFEAATETMICNGCHALVDVMVARRGEPDKEFIPVSPRCPNCRGDGVTPWERSRPCPKCGSAMVDGGVTVMWD
ncbi:MAG: hypothetical protein IIB03_02510 [Acidobacteria bacterium]|nr:hypothetical protein [Acidobacteriota bacterium]